MLLTGQKLVQLPFSLDSPDGEHMVILQHIGVGSRGVVDKTSCESFHGDKAHVRRLTFFHKLQLLVRGQIAEGELQRVVESAVDGFMCNRQAMIRDTDVADLSLRFRFQHGLIEPASVPRLRTEGDVVELVNIQVISLQIAKRGLQVLPESRCILRTGLGGEINPAATIRKSCTQFLLTVCIKSCGVIKINPAVKGLVQEVYSLLLGNALYGERSEAVFIYCNTGLSKCYFPHKFSSL